MRQWGIVLGVCCAVIIGAVGWRLWWLYQPLPPPAREDPLSGELFRQLQTASLLETSADGRVLLPSIDKVLSEREACQNGESCPAGEQADLDKRQDWLEKLYYTPAGQRVRDEVAAWNHTRRFAAVRDQFPAADDINRWQAYTPSGWPVTARSLVPLAFASINGDTLPNGYHDWLSASHDGQVVVFVRSFDLKSPATLRLQVIGTPDLGDISSFNPRILWKRPGGTTLSLALPAGHSEVRLPVTTATNPEERTDGLALQAQDGHIIWQGSPAPAVADAGGSNNVPRANPGLSGNKPFQIVTRDGEALTGAGELAGQPTEFAVRNGLLALVGQDKQDVYSLSGLLNQSNLSQPTEVRLTLDSRWQALAQTLLNRQFTRGNNSAQPAMSGQRTGLVVMNPATGAILAAAGTPAPPEDVHPWDRETYSKLHPELDPFQFVPWQGGDEHQAPGSTFKLVTSLALLEGAPSDQGLMEVIKGAPIGRVAQLLGMRIDQSVWEPPLPKTPEVNNYSASESLRWLEKKNLYRADCGRDARPGKKPGLRESLSESLNTWFAAATVRMDGAALGADNADKTHLLGVSKRLGFGEYAELTTTDLPLRRYLPIRRNGRVVGRGDVLNASLGQMALADPNPVLGSWGNRLVRSSFGQGISTTPLQMAQVASAAATGKVPPVHLLQQWNGKALSYPPGQPLDIETGILREGMKAVPEQGTAAGAFRGDKLACRTYGKTGTADVPDGTRTAWFVGWLADSDDMQASQPQVVFACMVTHAAGAGGSVCAPIAHELLVQAQAEGLTP